VNEKKKKREKEKKDLCVSVFGTFFPSQHMLLPFPSFLSSSSSSFSLHSFQFNERKEKKHPPPPPTSYFPPFLLAT
jgi:hypothetical protein